MSRPRRIAISTGGGDAPGLNAVIRATVLAAHERGFETVGIRDGYHGLLSPESYPRGGVIPLDPQAVRAITHLGGTILGTTNRGNPLRYPTQREDGAWFERDRSDELVARFREAGIDALVCVGGDGSLAIAEVLSRKGLPVVGVPKTIDNDLVHTIATFGFDSAVSFATECLDRLRSTAESHGRVLVVEVMGRYAGWIALHAGIAGAADAILIPEIPFDLERVAAVVRAREASGEHASIVVVAEGAVSVGGARAVVSQELGRAERLGGAGERIAADLGKLTGKETRVVVLGHLLRGGSPTSFDRLIGLRFGAAAVRAIDEGQTGVMIALDPPTVRHVPLADVTGRMKTVPVDCDTVRTARDLGVCFGD